jgi:hypothetical protein
MSTNNLEMRDASVLTGHWCVIQGKDGIGSPPWRALTRAGLTTDCACLSECEDKNTTPFAFTTSF